ncbi:MAG: sigma 54-interacting transcriptional regulator [Chloroflexi bacterium]|nr:sigma 54-interacting transcriptional regulator [Chloroflexota bacterium]
MSGYQTSPVKVEMRRNLISILREGKEIFPGIIGYDNTVVPQIENAILAGQDIVFLGERGQAKSRIMRLLVGLLDVAIPAIEGCEINDNPFSPVCRQCRERVREEGDNTGIMWLTREERYSEKLATPDITIADLIGDVDPIKVAEGRYLSDEKTIHYGLIPRTNRGILCINELPDLPERLQVGLFNVMEERDIQIRGYRIRLPLDTFVAASANPEDYTNRGRIITPLKDRFGAQVRTHYPADVDHEMAIMDKERWRSAEGPECYVPLFMKETIASITHLARKSPDVNQTSGVSVRVSISNYETIVSNSARRALTLGERAAVPRISDLPYIHSSTAGKIELESFEDGKEGKVVDDLIRKAVLEVFNRYYREDNLESIVARFNEGFAIEVSDTMNSRSYIRLLDENPGLKDAVRKLDLPESPEATASALEFVLEGLHLNRRLNKVEIKGKTVYRR